jgi:hypothetical protein
MTPASCLHVRLAPARGPGSFKVAPWRDRGLVIVVGPSTGGAWRKCAGVNDGPIAPENQRQPLGVTKRQCRTVVGRLLDMLRKDAGVVSALQHSRKIVSPDTFRPMECLTGLALCLPLRSLRG